MPIVRFEQDPDEQIGTGNFFDERGAATYTHDPETARKLIPSLAGRVAAESTAAATAAVGAPQAQPDRRLASNMTEAFGGVGGPATDAAVADVPAPSPGAALVAKTEAVIAPTAPPAPAGKGTGAGAALVSKLGQLPIAQTSTSTSVQKGRNKQVVEGEIATLREADQKADEVLRTNAASAEERATRAEQSEQAVAMGGMQRDFRKAEEQRLKAEAVEAELAQLRGENDAEVNPDRVMQNMSTGKKIMMTLLAGLSGAFASLAGQPGKNTFLDAIDARIAEDVTNQKEQIASGRLRRNNLIAALQQKGATAEQAQLAAESRYYGAMADWTRSRIREQNLQGSQLEAANAQIAQLDQQRAARDAQLRQTTEDKVASQTNVVRAPPAPAAGSQMSPLDVLKLQNALLDQQDAAEISKIVGKNLSPERVKELKATVKEVGTGVAETSGAVNMTKNLVEALGGKLDETTGAISWPDDLRGAGPIDTFGQAGASRFIPGPALAATGAIAAAKGTGLVRTDYDRAVKAQNALKEYVTQNLTGATASPEQRSTFGEMVGGSLQNEAEVKESIQNWANTLFEIRNGQLGRLGEDGQALLNHNTQRARSGAGAPPLVPR